MRAANWARAWSVVVVEVALPGMQALAVEPVVARKLNRRASAQRIATETILLWPHFLVATLGVHLDSTRLVAHGFGSGVPKINRCRVSGKNTVLFTLRADRAQRALGAGGPPARAAPTPAAPPARVSRGSRAANESRGGVWVFFLVTGSPQPQPAATLQLRLEATTRGNNLAQEGLTVRGTDSSTADPHRGAATLRAFEHDSPTSC